MKKLLFLILCFALFLSSCSKSSDSVTPANPIPNFTIVNENNLRAPVEVNFTNTSTDADTYEWTFDGITSKDKDNSEVIYNGGTYTITLKATKGGVSKTATKTFNVLPAYTKVRIKNVRIANIPFTDNNGASWDFNGGLPDVYFELLSPNPNNTLLVTSQANQIDNVSQSSLPISWNLTPFYLLPTLGDTYFIRVKDKDNPPVDNDDIIGAVSFTMSQYTLYLSTQKYPSEITRTQNNITIVLSLQWEL